MHAADDCKGYRARVRGLQGIAYLHTKVYCGSSYHKSITSDRSLVNGNLSPHRTVKMLEAVMANKAPRDRAIAPSFPSTTKGEIDVWIRVLRDHARLKLCFRLISGVADVNRPQDQIDEQRATASAAVIAFAAGDVPVPYDGDPKSERRLATLLWR
jgi:hypothetical protein